MATPTTWEELRSEVNRLETVLVDAALHFYRRIEDEDLPVQTAIQVDREMVEAQKRMRRLKGIIAEATDDA